MKEKKTAVLTVRITPRIKAAIDAAAAEREWTSSKMAEKILTAWVLEHSSVEESRS